LDSFDAARRFLASLRRTQWLSPADLARYQAPLLEKLCRHAACETDFNTERLRILFANGDPVRGAFLFENWRLVPIFDRAGAQAASESLNARHTPEIAGPAKPMQTSGSTGRPLKFGRSALAEIAGLARGELVFEAHKFDPAARMGWILFVSEKEGWTEQVTHGWTLSNPNSELFLLSKAASMAQCAEWLRRVKPRYLMAPPSIVSEIVNEVRGNGGEPISLERILITSEAPAETLAEDVAAVFGAWVVDNYGSREVGEIACTCPDNGPAKHVAAETVLVEIVKPDGAPAKSGEMGTVVVTPFYNYATPLIRYDIGDFAIQGQPACRCGRSLPLIERVLGRHRALFRFKDGTTRFPTGLNAMRRHVPWLQMQLVQTHLDRIEVRYVPDPNGGPADTTAAANLARARLHADLSIDFVAMTQIDRGQSGKFEEIISLLNA
jgi:phenylacetate-CoA ligase